MRFASARSASRGGRAADCGFCAFYKGRLARNLRGAPYLVPLSEIDTLRDSYTVAVNVHSFSEQTHASIKWWLDEIAKRDITWLLIVPNTYGELLSTEVGGAREDFMPTVLAAGYELADHRTVYQNDDMREMIGLHDEFFLFKKTD